MPTWGPTFNDQPPGSQSPSLGDDRIREGREAVFERFENEHRMHTDGTDGLASKDGIHKQGTAVVFYTNTMPETYANGDVLDANADGKLWFRPEHQQMHVYSHAAGASTVERWVKLGLNDQAQTIEGNKVFEGDVTHTGALVIPVLAEDPEDPATGQIWIIEA